MLKASLTELLEGPECQPRSPGALKQIPAGTKLRGVSIAANVAIIDLTGAYSSGGGTLSMTNRLAQVVYTCTQFQGVDAVHFKIDGKVLKCSAARASCSTGRRRVPTTRTPRRRSLSTLPRGVRH